MYLHKYCTIISQQMIWLLETVLVNEPLFEFIFPGNTIQSMENLKLQ